MYCTYDGFDLKCIFKKQKHSVCTSIQVDVGVIVISAPQSNGTCKWFMQTGAQTTFVVIYCSRTMMARTTDLAINNAYNGSNSAFSTYHAPVKKNGDYKYSKSNVTVQTVIINTRNFSMHHNSPFFKSRQLVSNTFQIILYTSINMDDVVHNDDFDLPNQLQVLVHILVESQSSSWISTCLMW
ncbi:hypothetical protein RFI_36904 [Reticulomyxa filosa]|uniref:Uncharacterized protein n=1 Tax=Reticulomyxa filosa TaxID=46433 RepID=X6LGN8_RETFI|nr:hypothetical protein RFI_36904 [Reticulomyxa filosa]|eukprot:ETO00536.1 hypothetical protein RFI_36904 [Reticulomyxa filosa]